MSDSETPRSLRDELEVRVIALLTGELSEADADELEKILIADEELSDFRDRMATLMGEVHSDRDAIAPPDTQPPMRLSEERRREIFGDVVTEEASPKEDTKKWWHLGLLEIAAMLIVAGILAAIMIPSVGAVRSVSSEARERAEARAADMEKQIAMAELGAPAEEFKVEMQRDIRTEGFEDQARPAPALRSMSRQRALPEETRMKEIASSGSGMSGEFEDFISADASSQSSTASAGLQSSRGQKKTRTDEVQIGADRNNFASGRVELEGSADFAVAQGAFNGYAESAPVDAFAPAPPQSAPTRSGPVDPFAASSAAAVPEPSSSNAPMALSERLINSYSVAESANREERSKLVAREESMRWNAGFGDMDEVEADRIATRSEMLTMVDQAWERPKVFESRGRVVADSMSASSLVPNKLDAIVIPQVRFKAMPLKRVIETLSELSVEYDHERTGVNIVPLINPEFDPKITLSLKGATLRDILTEVSKMSGAELIETSEAAVLRNLDFEWTDLGGRGGKMQMIMLPQVQFNGMPLSEVVEVLQELSKEYDPERQGVSLEYKPIRGEDPRVNIALRNLSLDRVLQFVTQQVGYEFVSMDEGALIQHRGQSAAEQMATERLKNIRQTPKAEKSTEEAPVSTFSLNVSDVSFKLAQAALSTQRIPAAELIRTEEFVNSFDYGDPTPRENEPVTLNWEIAQHPFAHDRQIVRFSLQTQAAGRAANQPLNLNLLIDNSGSMQRPDRRAILEKGLESLQSKLTDQDQLNIVLFARQPKLIASASNVREQKAGIERALDYQPQGGTNLESGLQVAYDVAAKNYNPAASNRVILMTDGAANLGDVDSSSLAEMVVGQREQGIALDAYGIGWEDYNDALLEEITRNGDGRYAFLNSADTAAADFSEKLAGTLRVGAADVKVQIIWNPERVKLYRQIGYELHQLRKEDFRDNTVDAAEIGEAESGTALYVLQVDDDPELSAALGTLQVRYRVPATGEYVERAWPLTMPRRIPALEDSSPSLRLAASSAFFAERLANNPYAATYSFEELEALTRDLPEAFPTQPRVVELQNMIQTADSLFTRFE